MQVTDALSRVENAPLLDPNAEESLNENDPYFPYESEEVGKISFLNYVIFNNDGIDHGYIADTEAESDLKSVTKNLSRNDSISTPTCNIAEYDVIDVSGNNGISTLTFNIVEHDLIVRDSSAVRRLFVRLARAVGRQSVLHKENSGFTAATLRFVAIGFYFLSETLI